MFKYFFRSIVALVSLFHFRGRRLFPLLNGVLFTKEIPNKIILLYMGYDVALRLQKIKSQK